MQPHRSRYWLNACPEDPVVFKQQVNGICQLHLNAQELLEQGTHIVSTDEMTGIQALERVHPTQPMHQLNIHKSASLVRLVAACCDLDIDLGVKGEEGILESMKTRAAFLSDRTHRIRFVYIPKHTSWLNQIECWFSILMRRLLKRGSFTSTDDLKQQILNFISYFNRTLAKPFVWKFEGYPEVA